MADGRVTYFVVLPFKPMPGRHEGVVAGDAIEAPSAEAAVRYAVKISERGGGALAFSRTGDPDVGEWDDAIILGEFGTLPPNLDSLVAA